MSRNISMVGMESIQAKFGVRTQPVDVATAAHEAAHAVAALALGIAVDDVSIERAGKLRGYCWYQLNVPPVGASKSDKELYAWRLLKITLAGPMAAKHMLEGGILRYAPDSASDQRDVKEALDLLEVYHPDRDRKEMLAKARTDVAELFDEYWSEVDELASALLAHRTVTGMRDLRWLCPKAAQRFDRVNTYLRLAAAA